MNKLWYYLKNSYIFIIIGVLLPLIIFFTSYLFVMKGDKNFSETASATNNIIQTFFYITALVIAILTYLQAKKTLFTPIKTEIFKMQIELFENIIGYFQSKSEYDFSKAFDFDKILIFNSELLIKSYVDLFFDSNLESSAISKFKKDFIGAIVTKDYAEKNFMVIEDFEPINTQNINNETTTNIKEKWAQYSHGMTHYTKQYFDQIEIIKNFVKSPLLPKDLILKINEFINTINSNLSKIGELLTEVATELPIKLPDIKSVKKLVYIFSQIGITE